jgi:transcriptional regulator with XRE-family HTH domain
MLEFERLYERVGRKIREVREAQEMSQEELAGILQLKRTSVTNIELGRQKLTLEAIYRLCDRFGLEIQDVLPALEVLRAPPAQSITVGGESHEVGSKVASLLTELRPAEARPPKRARR